MIYKETDIHEETHKGRKPLLLRMIGSLLCSIHDLSLRTNSKWGYNLFFNKIQLVESTNPLISLAPTRRKHQLPECSSTNWMEAPNSSYTSSNLYNREHLFSLAPPCHPGFSSYNQMKLQLSVFNISLEPLRTTVLPSTSQPPLNIND